MFDVIEPPSPLPTSVVKVGDIVRTQSVGMEGVPAVGKVLAINPDGVVEVELSPIPADTAKGTIDEGNAEAMYERLGLPSKLQSSQRQQSVRVPLSQVIPLTAEKSDHDHDITIPQHTNNNEGENKDNMDMNQAGGGVPLPHSTSQKSAVGKLETWVASQDHQLTAQRQGRLAPLPVITINGLPVSFAKLYRDKTESTSDPHIMLKRMLVRHVFGDEAYARSSSLFHVLDDLKPADVYLQLIDASLLLDWAFITTVTFFPGGEALSHYEINECHRRLDRFWKEKEASWAVKKLRLNFATFSQWFLVTVNELMQDRTGFVQMITINDADAFEEKIKESRALAVSQRDDAVRSMVARADEVNKHLIDRKVKRARSERNQITSEKSDVSDLNTSTRGIPVSTHVHRFHPTERERFDPVLSKFAEEQKTITTTPPSNDVHTILPRSVAWTPVDGSSSSPGPVAGGTRTRNNLTDIMQSNPNLNFLTLTLF